MKKRPAKKPARPHRSTGRKAPMLRYSVAASEVDRLRRDVHGLLEQGEDDVPASGYRTVLTRFAAALDLLPPEDDLPLEPSEGGGLPVFGRSASPTQTFYASEGGSYLDMDPAERGRLNALVDYEDMVLQFPEFGRALEVISQGATSNDRGGPPYRTIFAPGVPQALRTLLDDMDERLHLKSEVRPICYSSTKLGDVFAELVVDDLGQINEMLPRPAGSMFVRYHPNGRLAGYEQKFQGQGAPIQFVPGQIVHLRAGHEWGCHYGTSMLRSGRFVYRKYAMMDDAMVVNRLVRAVQRYEFQVDVTGLDRLEAERHIKRIMERNRRQPIVHSDGRLNLATRAMADLQDVYTGVKTPGLGGTRVLEGSRTLSTIADVQQVYRRLLTTIPVPPSFMGIEADVNARATVNEEAINFARYERAKQSRELAPFVAKIYRRQAALAGAVLGRADLEVRFGPVSVLDEKMRADTLLAKANAAKVLGVDLGFPTEFLVRQVLDLSEDDADEVMAMIADLEADQVMPPPTAPPPVPDNAPVAAARVGRSVRGILEANRTTQAALHGLTEAMKFIAAERRRADAAKLTPTPVDGPDGG